MDFDSRVAQGQALSNRVYDSVVVGMEVDIKSFDAVLVMMADELFKAVFIAGTKKGQRDFVVGPDVSHQIVTTGWLL
jgi:hypothetical protein